MRWMLVAAVLVAMPPGTAAQGVGDRLARVEELLEAELPREALRVVGQVLAEDPENARALLHRSTARLMLGEVEAGREDLTQALVLDPRLRRGWMNLAALALSEGRLEEALEAFQTAKVLDPAAPDSDLNIGAVLVLMGRLEEASRSFQAYLAGHEGSAEAYYLVATNYSVAGYAGLAVEHLRQAILLDERVRVRARADASFNSLEELPAFQELMSTDPYQPPPGSHQAVRRYPVPYRGGDGPLMKAVVDAVAATGTSVDPRLEITPAWALLWGDLRVKVTTAEDGRGEIRLTAAAQTMTPAEWSRCSRALLEEVAAQLAKYAS